MSILSKTCKYVDFSIVILIQFNFSKCFVANRSVHPVLGHAEPVNSHWERRVSRTGRGRSGILGLAQRVPNALIDP